MSWFEPGLNDPMNSTHWMWNYPEFLSKLEGNFGPHNPVGNSEKALSELAMNKTARITKYNVDFWELASQVNWNEAALHEQYFCGLPLRIRMGVLHGGKPHTLAALRLKAQDADNIYWMQEEESKLENKTSGASGGNSGHSGKKDANRNYSNSGSHPKSNSSNNQSKSSSSNYSSSSGSKGSSKDKPKNSISDKLGEDGKLTGEEQERHKIGRAHV